ncbi:phosphoribosylanthranilate isomerase [Methanofollis sp. W23]|uniref:phosphoribosylanthranilate isomerase n=1 Tax=Methanofollis sp. W23 TaxID=2817849 RepID=UPI001AE9F721|nr:phosphoribosylanthranilate isomerase [Methanofollis sp. W23]MBP2146518.1 phosphoribosylanthranilate isomerase [Methanofollis sp. W23]
MTQEYVRVKICGVTRPEDARAAEAAGADAVGVVMYSDSPRSVSPDKASAIFSALGPFMARVVVTHTPSPEDLAEVLALGPTAVQISYPHDVPETCGTAVIRVVGRDRPVPPLHADAYIVDESMGRGRLFDPVSARRIIEKSGVPVVLAGGLTPENVRAAVRAVGPYAVDVCSGVETRPGVKDPALVRGFVAAVKG